MLRFRTETSLNVVSEFDSKADAIVDQEEVTFKQGEKVDADIFTVDGDYCDIQFADGSVATSVLRDAIEEV